MKPSKTTHSIDRSERFAPNDQRTQYATFFVDSMFFGVDVLKVQEVLRSQEMTPVPLAPKVIRGLINLRGQIVTAIDMRQRLSLPPRSGETQPMNVVVRSDEGAVSLLVDEIGDVIEVETSRFETPPINMPTAQRHLVEGLYKLDGRLLLVLNTEKTLEVPAQV
jgi:purine-binding chemotaxis protein CheW